jgi:hypothetical protein
MAGSMEALIQIKNYWSVNTAYVLLIQTFDQRMLNMTYANSSLL